MLTDFKAFLLKQNIVALAIAVVIGAALGKVVTSFVDNFIMPIVGAVMPDGNWREAKWHVGSIAFGVGDFLSAVLGFVIVGFVAWRVAKLFIKEEAAAPTKICSYCRSTIDLQATRCPQCTSQIAAA